MNLVLALGGFAFAQSPRHIEVPDPGVEAAPAPIPPTGEPEATAEPVPVAASVGVGGSAPRRGPREVIGESPASLWGRYTVVQVTEAGTTDDFVIKMERAGKALHQDCIVVALVFEFGEARVGGGLPGSLQIAEQQVCQKGGLGRYGNEVAVEVLAKWTKVEGGLQLSLPEVEASAALTRIKKPAGSELGSPPHWLGPESRLVRAATEYLVRAELPRGKAVAPPDAIHLVAADGTVLHLEPEPAGAMFNR